MERAEAYRLHIEWALRQPSLYERPIASRPPRQNSTNATLNHRWVAVGREFNCSGWRVVFG